MPKKTNSPTDALSILKSDHREVKRLLKKLNDRTFADDSQQLLAEIQSMLKAHTQMEEEIFYPAFKEAVEESDQHIYFEAVEEHGLVDAVLPKFDPSDTESPEFEALAKVLQDLVTHHIKEEEDQMFTKARKALGEDGLREVGERMRAFKQQVEAGGPDLADDDTQLDEGRDPAA